MKIYTKKGDSGTTQLIGGTRVAKSHHRIEAYGTVDELNSYIGLVRDQSIDTANIKMLIEIQDRLFTIGALLASDPSKKGMQLPTISNQDVEELELEIDRMNEQLPEMRSFVLPGGHTTVSFCHLARCVCRRAERLCINLEESTLQKELVLMYLNRLSDYLFVLSRFLSKELGVKEVPWQPKS